MSKVEITPENVHAVAMTAGQFRSESLVLSVTHVRTLLEDAEARGRLMLEQRIREIVATSRCLGLSRGTCESLCEELLEETNEDIAKLHKQERDEDMANAEARGRAAERADVVEFLRGLYESMRRIIRSGEHVGAAGKEREDG